MAKVKPVAPVALFCGIIGSDSDLMDYAVNMLCPKYGKIDIVSRLIAFDGSDYYEAEMGKGLFRRFYSFLDLIPPDEIANVKLSTQGIEANYCVNIAGEIRRQVNLDPGYIAPSRLVLATTKDFSHRVYLQKGIYAEVTLNFSKRGCRYLDWTYPDFRQDSYTEFFLEVRKKLLKR